MLGKDTGAKVTIVYVGSAIFVAEQSNATKTKKIGSVLWGNAILKKTR